MGRFTGRVALVTGAAAGMGQACAEMFARDGARVVLGDISTAGEAVAAGIRAKGGDAVFLRTDVTDEAQAKALVDAALNQFGRLDHAANMAGISVSGDTSYGLYADAPSREKMVAVSLTGTFNMVRPEVAAMRRSGGGTIVNCASYGGIAGSAEAPYYVAAKHGVVGFTKSVALEFAAHGIRCNVICPGFTRTAMSEGHLGDRLDELASVYTPLGRIGEAHEQASAVCWLCSDDSSFVTGAVLPVDGGLAAGPKSSFSSE